MKLPFPIFLVSISLFVSCSEKQIYEADPTAASVQESILTLSQNKGYEKYTGVYRMEKASFDQVAITLEGGKLYVQASGEKKVEIYPEAGNSNAFSVPAFQAKIVFKQETDSTFSTISVLLSGNELTGKRK